MRQKIGQWIYYVTSFTFEEVSQSIQKEWKEEMGLDNANSEDRLQRGLEQKNVEQISNYIRNQSDMFFNSLVLAVYNGDPQWREIRIEYENEEHYDMGVLELTEEDKIFPVDGQHRVEGIRNIVESTGGHKNEGDNYYNLQTIPVILIAHENTIQGKKRTRRLFTTLNRYAKPVNKTDIILLAEDDLVAIVTRRLIDNNNLFNEERLLLSQTKAISKSDRKSFTNIQTMYDCNYLLLRLYINGHDLYMNVNNRKKKVSSKKKSDLIEFLKFRRDDSEIEEFYSFVNNFWSKFSELRPIDMFLNPKETDFMVLFTEDDEYRFDELFLRGPILEKEKEALDNMINSNTYCPPCYEISMYPFKEGGNILFRPFGLISVISVVCELVKKSFKLEDIIKRLNFIDLSLSYNIWDDIIYKISDDRMITSNKKLFEEILMYLLYPEIYEEELLSSLCNRISVFWINSNELKEIIDAAEDSDKVKVEKEYKSNILSKIKNLLLSSNYLSMYEEWEEDNDVNI